MPGLGRDAQAHPEAAFEVVFEPRSARRVSRYVALSFFGVRELPQAAARMLLTREFALFVAVPLVLLLAARFAVASFSHALFWIAVLWLLAGLLRIARYGRARGIACFIQEADGSRGALVGGLRMRLEKRARRLWIAGLIVEPSARGHGIGTALVLAAFKLAQREARQGPVTVTVFAPSHPASKAIVARHLEGARAVVVSQPISGEARRVIERLEASLDRSFTWRLAEPARLFGP